MKKERRKEGKGMPLVNLASPSLLSLGVLGTMGSAPLILGGAAALPTYPDSRPRCSPI